MNNYETLLRIKGNLEVNEIYQRDIEDLDLILETMDKQPPVFILTEDEAKHLWDYFVNRAGYISFEFDLPVHKITDRLKVWVEKRD